MKIVLQATCSTLLTAMCSMFAAGAFATSGEVAPGCGKLTNAYGPYDYRVHKKQLELVERHHFSADIENLRRTGGGAGGLDYTLRAFPNHHRALMSMMKLGLRDKTNKPYKATFTVECYMIRAEAWRPDDAVVKAIFGLYLIKNGQQAAGVEKLEAAKALGTNDPSIPYNMGLVYFELGQYDKALENAHDAYGRGFPLPGLKDKLVKAGKWKEPAAENAAAAPAEKPTSERPPEKAAPEAGADKSSATPSSSASN